MYANGCETTRLFVRSLAPDDEKIWSSFFEQNPNLPFLGLELDKSPTEHASEWISMQLKRYEEGRYGHHALVLKKTGELIGQAGLLTQEVDGEVEIEIGYHILPKHWGQGFATEAARFFRDFGFQNEQLEHMVSLIDVRNHASQRVAFKNGMAVEKRITCWGLEIDVYGIKRTEWLSRGMTN